MVLGTSLIVVGTVPWITSSNLPCLPSNVRGGGTGSCRLCGRPGRSRESRWGSQRWQSGLDGQIASGPDSCGYDDIQIMPHNMSPPQEELDTTAAPNTCKIQQIAT